MFLSHSILKSSQISQVPIPGNPRHPTNVKKTSEFLGVGHREQLSVECTSQCIHWWRQWFLKISELSSEMEVPCPASNPLSWRMYESHGQGRKIILAVAVSCCIMFQCFNDVRNLLKPSGYGSKYEPTKKRMVQKMLPKANNPSLRLVNTFKYPILGTQQYVPRLHSQNSWPSLVKLCSAWGGFFG